MCTTQQWPSSYVPGGQPARSSAALQTTTDAHEQNSTGPLGGPVINCDTGFYVFVEFQSYRDITLLNQDGMNNVLSVTNRMIYEKWIKLTDMCRTQVDLTVSTIVLSVA